MLCWKTKLLKQAPYVRYVLAKLSKFAQISTDLLRFLFTDDSLKIKEGLELVFQAIFFKEFLDKKLFCNAT